MTPITERERERLGLKRPRPGFQWFRIIEWHWFDWDWEPSGEEKDFGAGFESVTKRYGPLVVAYKTKELGTINQAIKKGKGSFAQLEYKDILWAKDQFGNKTINQIRAERGCPPAIGGDIVYVDWLTEMADFPFKPGLEVIQGGKEQKP